MSKVPPPRLHIYGDDYVPYYLSHLNNRLSSGASQLYLTRFGVGLNEWRILSVLANAPGSTANHICQTLGLHKAVVSRALRDLEHKGLVDIDGAKRQRLLRLTPAGDRLHDEIIVIALGREERLLAGFSAEERAQLLRFMQRMMENLPAANAWDPFQDTEGAPSKPD